MSNRLTRPAFIRYTAVFTLLEALIVAYAARFTAQWLPTWGLLIGASASAFISILVFKISHDPLISAVGVAGLSFSLGVLLGPILGYYTPSAVLEAVFVTCAIMAGMSLVGIAFPRALLGWGAFLAGALWILIAVLFSQTVLTAVGLAEASSAPVNTWLAWVGIVIFTFLVAYDWNAALNGDLTIDDAIDASGGLILDAVNLFIRIASLFGNQPRNR